MTNEPINRNNTVHVDSTRSSRESAVVGAICVEVAAVILAAGCGWITAGETGLLSKLPWIVWGLISLVAIYWVLNSLHMADQHARSVELYREESDAAVRDRHATAQILLAKAQYTEARAKIEIAAAQANRPMISTAPKVDESQLRTQDIPDGRGGYFNISITQLRGLMAAYPATSRSQLEAAKVVSGGTDAQRLIGAAIFFGWMSKDRNNGSNGKGVEAEWAMEMAQIRQSFYGIYYEAMQRANKSITGGTHSSALLVEGVSRPVD